jgi:predicted glycoside hydrolase/deacetylase ChbG (UPF0249 family)
MNTKVSRNAPCPCGSGMKYKKCCLDKGFQWTQDEQGQILKTLPMNEEVRNVLLRQRQKFVETYGREPDHGDSVFFDLPSDEIVQEQMVEVMQEVGMDPAIIYAYKTTGMLVGESNYSQWSEEELAEWYAAIDEYDHIQKNLN